MIDILESMKSINEVAIQGIKSGQEIADRKYAPLLEAAKEMRDRLANMKWETEEDRQFCLDDWDKAIALAETSYGIK